MYEYMQEPDMERLKKVIDKCLPTVWVAVHAGWYSYYTTPKKLHEINSIVFFIFFYFKNLGSNVDTKPK